MLNSNDNAHELAFDHEFLSTDRSERLVPFQRLRSVMLVIREKRKDIKLPEIPPALLDLRSPWPPNGRSGPNLEPIAALRNPILSP